MKELRLFLLVAALALSPEVRAQQQTAVNLGSAGTCAVLSGTTVTNTGPTVVNGNLGVWPGTAVTGAASNSTRSLCMTDEPWIRSSPSTRVPLCSRKRAITRFSCSTRMRVKPSVEAPTPPKSMSATRTPSPAVKPVWTNVGVSDISTFSSSHCP